MKPNRKLAAMLCVTVVALASAMPAIAASDDERFAAAMQLYHDGRYSAAYGHLAKLADGGHREAARIALLMVRFGPQLYSAQWSASRYQIALWAGLAGAKQPSIVADGGD